MANCVRDAIDIKLDKEPAIKTPDQYKFIGKRMARLDMPLKINGSAIYGIDINVPDMVHAAIMACPVFGGRLKCVDESTIAGRRGVIQVVKLRNAVAVIADRYWRAKARSTSCDRVGSGAAAHTDSAQFRKTYHRGASKKGAVARHDGDVDAAMPTAAKVFEAIYEVPHHRACADGATQLHAHVQADRVDVWVGTQNADSRWRSPRGLRREAGKCLYPQYLFGRRFRPKAASRRSRASGRRSARRSASRSS